MNEMKIMKNKIKKKKNLETRDLLIADFNGCNWF